MPIYYNNNLSSKDGQINAGKNLIQDIGENFNAAIRCYQRGELTNAAKVYLDIIEGQPCNFNATYMLGVIACQMNEFDISIALTKKAIQINPKYAPAYSNLAFSLRKKERFQEALENYEKAIALNKDESDYYFQHAITLATIGANELAVASYQNAIILQPNFATAHNNMGVALDKLGRITDAKDSFEKAIDARINFHEAYFNLGNILDKLEHSSEAILRYSQAIEINPQYVDAFINRANVLKKLNRFQESIADLISAVNINPSSYEAYINLGAVYVEIKELQEAISCYDEALKIKPNYAEAQWNKSLALLLNGNYIEGFKLYESRWSRETFTSPRRDFSKPIWFGGESLKGKILLVHAEQGFGDTIQFCRFVLLLERLAERIILEVPETLVGIMHTLQLGTEIVKQGDLIPQFDCHIPLMSLPLALRISLESFPMMTSYLRVPAVKRDYWIQKLGAKKCSRIGLVWSGNPFPKKNIHRSIDFADMVRYLPQGFEYISLQKEFHDTNTQSLDKNRICHFESDIYDFSDTAALCTMMDLVITVDTSVAHLAGALGVKTWVLVPYLPDWRWMLDREDSIWYNNMKIFRQDEGRQWLPVLQRVFEEITTILIDK